MPIHLTDEFVGLQDFGDKFKDVGTRFRIEWRAAGASHDDTYLETLAQFEADLTVHKLSGKGTPENLARVRDIIEDEMELALD